MVKYNKKPKIDYDDYFHVEMSFIATCSAAQAYNELPVNALNSYIDRCKREGRYKTVRVAEDNKDKLRAKYLKWSKKQLKKLGIKQPEFNDGVDIELIQSAIQMLNEHGYKVYREA